MCMIQTERWLEIVLTSRRFLVKVPICPSTIFCEDNLIAIIVLIPGLPSATFPFQEEGLPDAIPSVVPRMEGTLVLGDRRRWPRTAHLFVPEALAVFVAAAIVVRVGVVAVRVVFDFPKVAVDLN